MQAFRDDAAHLCKIVRGGVLVVPGMSSTPAMSSIRRRSASGGQGASPTPQLPITMVVTPWLKEGSSLSFQLT